MNKHTVRPLIGVLLILAAAVVAACRAENTASASAETETVAKPDAEDRVRCEGTAEVKKDSIRDGVPARVLEALDRLEKLGETIKDLQAELKLEKLETLVADRTIKEGQLYYQRNKKKIRFRVSFETTLNDRLPIADPEHFVFADGWLRWRQERIKREDHYQVTRPGQPSTDLMRIGKSPLPIPIGQKTEDVLKNFQVSLIDPDKKIDPAKVKSVHLKLVPRKGTELAMSHMRLEFWMACEGYLPIRSQWENDSGDIFTADMTKVQINKNIKDRIFKLSKLPRDYEFKAHPLPEEPDK